MLQHFLMGIIVGTGGLWLPEMVDLSGGDQELLEPGAAGRSIAWDEVGTPSQTILLVCTTPYYMCSVPFHPTCSLPSEPPCWYTRDLHIAAPAVILQVLPAPASVDDAGDNLKTSVW